ncbi:MAG: hypothetical protein J5602_09785, partial [Clostridia bacterium]|nr:hypothetical protein [Clostridia bacterium]
MEGSAAARDREAFRKKPTELMFFFDTEDYTTPRSCDAARDLMELFREEGVRAHVALVGYLARQLVAWRREDMLDALRYHVIGTHTLYHSVHPDICELSDAEDYGEAYRRVLAQEAEGVGMIRAATGVDRIAFATPPGNSKSYVAMYVYADLGIPFYCDTVACDAAGSDLWYCGARHVEYNFSLEGFLPGGEEADAGRVLDELAARERAIVYCHPNMAVFREFWDGVNYNGGNLAPFGQWKPCAPRAPEETAAYYSRIRAFLRRVKADGRFRLVTVPELDAARKPRVKLRREDMRFLRDRLRERFAPIDEPSLCLADIFQATVCLLRGAEEFAPGRAKGFLEAPRGIEEPVALRSADLRAAAAHIDLQGFLPSEIDVGGRRLGPADFLRAALDALA